MCACRGFLFPLLRCANEFPRVVVSIASISISNSRRRLLTLSPNAFPAVRYAAKREPGDDAPIEYIQVRSALRALAIVI